MSLADDARALDAAQRLSDKREAALQRENLRLSQEIDRLERQLGLVDRLSGAVLAPPKWLRTVRGKRGRTATSMAMLSDIHYGEVVNPHEVGEYNSYNPQIAALRLRRFADRWLTLTRDYVAGVQIEGGVLLLGGDLLSGNIHDELLATNADPVIASAVELAEYLVAVINEVVDDLGALYVVSVPGNHGRMTRKPIAKQRARSNFDWLVSKMVERSFSGDARVTFSIPDAFDARVQVYNTRLLLTHGDTFRGGSGISGARAPLLLGQHRMSVMQEAFGEPIDYLAVAHFHQYQAASQGLIMNGSLKGLDEYAVSIRVRPEVPQQAWMIVSPEHGITINAPILAAGTRREERW